MASVTNTWLLTTHYSWSPHSPPWGSPWLLAPPATVPSTGGSGGWSPSGTELEGWWGRHAEWVHYHTICRVLYKLQLVFCIKTIKGSETIHFACLYPMSSVVDTMKPRIKPCTAVSKDQKLSICCNVCNFKKLRFFFIPSSIIYTINNREGLNLTHFDFKHLVTHGSPMTQSTAHVR